MYNNNLMNEKEIFGNRDKNSEKMYQLFANEILFKFI